MFREALHAQLSAKWMDGGRKALLSRNQSSHRDKTKQRARGTDIALRSSLDSANVDLVGGQRIYVGCGSVRWVLIDSAVTMMVLAS